MGAGEMRANLQCAPLRTPTLREECAGDKRADHWRGEGRTPAPRVRNARHLFDDDAGLFGLGVV